MSRTKHDDRRAPRSQPVERLEPRRLLSTVVVNTTGDDLPSSPSSGVMSLRDAIAIADNSATPITIAFDTKLFAISQTITFTQGALHLTNANHATTIHGPSAGVTISNPQGGGFTIDARVQASFSRINVLDCLDSGIANAGQLTITNSDISGNQAKVDGGGIANTGSLNLSNVSLTSNTAERFGGGIASSGVATLDHITVTRSFAGFHGGGISNSGLLNLNHSILSNNSTAFSGGGGAGLHNDGTATLVGVTVSSNEAFGDELSGSDGGGIANFGNIQLRNCTLSLNKTDGRGSQGGGLYNFKTAIVRGSTFSNNSSDTGAGLLNLTTATVINSAFLSNDAGFSGGGVENLFGEASLVNVTIAGNIASGLDDFLMPIGFGGGIRNSGNLSVCNSTISGNAAVADSGGIYNFTAVGGVTTISNSIVAANSTLADTGVVPDVAGAFHSRGHNLIGQTNGSSGWAASDLTGTAAHPLNAMLAPLGNYGGPTQTMPPLPSSPAIDRGSNALIPAKITTDQRGLPRIIDGVVDIGAVEFQSHVTGLLLIDADTGQTIISLSDGATLDLSKLPQHLNVVAVVAGKQIASVLFGLDANSRFRLERGAPYSLFGDTAGRYFFGSITPGQHTIRAQAFADGAAIEPLGSILTVHITVTY
ncbi:MAG TPA: choice-of-anchor Q domain-containing protein [Humisphaera sp.]|jgi:predicted outer membrane repeat protein|nr:choice-of-anchor Q domain-containing protein [Humisphaera sp.]